MTAFVPGADRIAQDVDEQPSLSGVHTVLPDPGTQHVIFVLHHGVAPGVDHAPQVAFGIGCYPGQIPLISVCLRVFVVFCRKYRPSHGVKMHDVGRIGMFGGLVGGLFFLRRVFAGSKQLCIDQTIGAIAKPRAFRFEQGVVRIVYRLLPGFKCHL